MSNRRSRKIAATTAALYVRVSALESQSESELSLEQQERQLRALAAAAGYAEEEIVVVRERTTASKVQPALEQLLDELDAGAHAALFVDKTDRLTRTGMVDAVRIAERAEGNGWRLVIGNVGADTTTAAGRIVLAVLAEIAREESKIKSARMRSYHAARRARGQIAGVHYGVKSTTSAQDAEPIVAAWIAGESYAGIARRLTEEQGRPWHATQVRRIVRAHSVQPLDLAA